MKSNNNFWNDKKVLITGGSGFLGTHLVSKMNNLGIKELSVPRSSQYDLRDKRACKEVVQNKDIVIHLAAKVGGIGYNMEKPGELFYDNIMMGVQLLDEAYKAGVKKFVGLGTICEFPKFCPVPFKEDDVWNGYPEETNAPYGLAKKMLLVQAQSYRKQYGFNAIHLMPTNLYGPGDNFDPNSSHVLPALIKKFLEAKNRGDEFVVVWGTGKATREFLYVEDCAEAIIMATERYNGAEPINIGSSLEISIKELAGLIKDLTGFSGELVWDSTKPDGQPRRKLNTQKALKEFGFSSKTTFKEGLRKTIKWYEKQHSAT